MKACLTRPYWAHGVTGSLHTSRPSRSRAGRRCGVQAQASIVARWCIDIRYGVKLEAVQLMQEWVRDVGSQAGLSAANARIHSGAVGVPESRLELEVEFESFAELEQFWASIPPADHKAWSQRMQGLVVHGSPSWEVYRTVPLLNPAGEEPANAAAATGPPGIGSSSSSGSGSGRVRGRLRSVPGGSGLLQQPSAEEIQELAPPQVGPPTGQTLESGIEVVSGKDAAQVVLDWKGDPMRINPGDKLPFTFR